MYQFLASLTLILHCTFILFVIFGALLFFVKRWTVYFHVPALCYGAYVEFAQSICPLTNVENYFLLKAESQMYSATFIQHYLYPIIYPAHLTPEIQINLGVALVMLNVIIYGYILIKKKKL